MYTKLLIDSIMRQTTVLIAQLTAAAGIRAPLSHLADEVFLSLSQELEDQGVPRKVVADMFGLALRTYQRRVQRLRESATEQGTTLWQAVLEYLQEEGSATRLSLFQRFDGDDPEAIGAVLSDLVRSGLVSRSGAGLGNATVFSPTPEKARQLMTKQGEEDTLTAMVWLEVIRNPGCSTDDVVRRMGLEEATTLRALDRLRNDGQLPADPDAPLVAEAMVIPVGAEAGWETAVFDHFQAVAAAITAKLRLGKARSKAEDTTGGATLTLEISKTHPMRDEVLGLLARFRSETDELWDRLQKTNDENPIAEADIEQVVFYFGQFVKHLESEA